MAPGKKIGASAVLDKIDNQIIFLHRLPPKTRLLIAAGLLVLSFVIGFIYVSLGATLTTWAMLIFFEVLVQKYLFKNKIGRGNVLDIQISAVLLGIIVTVAPLLYFDSLYFLQISALDFLSRYIWFLLPLSRFLAKQKGLKYLL